MRSADSRIAATAIGLLFLGCSLLHVGCRGSRGSSTVTHGSIGWESADKERSVPGIDYAMLRWYIRGEQLTYVIWTDLHGGGGSSSGSGGGSSSGLEHHQAHLDSRDGDRFEYEYKLDLDDRGSGAITIDDANYNLKDGSLLLVSTQGKKLQVKQLDLGPSIIGLLRGKSQTEGPIRAAYKAMANDNSDVRSFFEDVTSGE